MKMEELNERQPSTPDRIMDILVFLLGEMRKNTNVSDIDLAPLSAKGYTQNEISTAFSWLFDKMASTGPTVLPQLSIWNSGQFEIEAPRPTSFRVYHEVERSVLSREAQGYLLQLREIGLLNDTDLESIIDRIMLSGISRIDAEDIRDLATGVIFDFDDSQRMGSRMMLSLTDRIQ